MRGHEGTFSIATYWYVDALARSDRLEEARLTFEKMATYANYVGLFSEQIGLTGGWISSGWGRLSEALGSSFSRLVLRLLNIAEHRYPRE